MQMSETIGELAKALCKAQAEMEPAVKSADNPFFHSKYADLTSIVNSSRPALAANGLVVSQVMDTAQGGEVPVTTILMHESGEWLAGTLVMKPTKTDPQGMGSAITYARRYALAAICGIAPEDEDDDGAAASGTPGSRPPTPQQGGGQYPACPAPPQPQPASGTTAPGTKPGCISAKQCRMLWAKMYGAAERSGGSADDVHTKLCGAFTVESMNDLPWKKMDEVIQWVDSYTGGE